MTRDDAPHFKQTLAAVYGLYGKELTPTALTIWFEALKGYDLQAINGALSKHCVNPDSGQFLPRPADVVRAIDGGGQDAALLAWAKVDRAVRTVGPYASVVFDDALIHHAISNMGGWIELGGKGDDEWPFVRNQFVTLYRGARGRMAEHPPKLIGSHEAHNARHGLKVNPPLLLGDPAKARAVFQAGKNTPAIEARPMNELIALPRAAA